MQSSQSEPHAALRIAEFFGALEDPRVVARSDHPLLTIVVMALCAVIAGCNGWDDIEEFGHDRRTWFESFLALPKGVPSADTFRRVLRALRPDAFAACMAAWVQSLAQPLAGQIVAFDGKALRGAMARSPYGRALHLVHVWAAKQRLLLAQAAVAGAPGEPDAVRALLALVDLRGAIATGDAAHCSAATAQAIRDAGADYVLHLKGNRAELHGPVATYFEMARACDFADVEVRHVRTTARGHGRVEVREAWSVPAADLDLPTASWPDLRSVTLIERTRTIGDASTTERHFYLASLEPNVRRIATAAREHWAVENDLHWVLDVQMGDDACAVADANAAQNLASLRRIGAMLLKREPSLQRGVAAKQAKAARNVDYLERVLACGTAAV